MARLSDASEMRILALETSCDDTCAAVLDGAHMLSNVISSQAAAHAQFGGVVPEVASRHHLELATPVVEAALAEAGVSLDGIEAVAVTAGPGLIGALLVGVSTAKAIAAPRRLPLISVDHLQGHVAANFLEPEPLEPPFLCLVASGGHTLLAGVRDFHQAQVANDQNEVMKRLTVIASCLLLPTFIVGLYGQNLRGSPELHWGFGYWWSWSLIIVTTIAQLVFFRRKGWV